MLNQQRPSLNLSNTGSATFAGTVTAPRFIGSVTGSVIGPTPPSDPSAGDLWYDSDNGGMYVFYNDGSSTQWVSTLGGAGSVVSSVNGKTGSVSLSAANVGALSTTGGTLTGGLTVQGGLQTLASLETPALKITGMTDFAVPYIKANGEVAAMTGVEYNELTETLKISKLDSPSTGEITVNADLQATGPAQFEDTVLVYKAATFNSTLNVGGGTTLSTLNVGDITGTGNYTTSGIVTATKFVGDGSELTNLAIPTGTNFKGTVNATTGTAPSAVSGDVYSNTTAGTADSSYTGIAGLALAANQLIFYSTEWELGGVEDVSNLVTLATTQTITGDKTLSGSTTFSGVLSASTTSNFNDTATFVKSNGRAIEIKTGSTLKGYWSGDGKITSTGYNQTGSATNNFVGPVSCSAAIQPTVNNGSDLGTSSYKFRKLYVNNINDSGDLTISGNTILGNNSSDRVSIKGYVNTQLSPDNTTRTLGSSTQAWGNIYSAGSVFAGITSSNPTIRCLL